MTRDLQNQTVVLHYSSSDSLAPHGPDEGPVVLVRTDSFEALVAYPQLGELLAEAALRGWQQQQRLQITVVTGPR